MTPSTQMPVSMRALLQRINRKLAHGEVVLKKTRGQHARTQFGAYYVLHWRSNHVRHWHVDPEAWGRELGVLAAWEGLKKDTEGRRNDQ